MNRGFKGVWIPREIWLDENLTIQEKALYAEIDSLDNDDGCYASNAHFAKFLGVSKDRVSRLINSLKDKGYVTVELQYKKDSKEIDRRIVRCTYTYRCKHRGGIGENTDTPIGENTKGSNTSINNTLEITEEDREPASALLDDGFKLIINTYNENIRPVTPIEAMRLETWLDDMEAEVIVSAIEEAIAYNKRSLKYIEGILKSWHSNNIKSKLDLDAYKRDWQDKKQKQAQVPGGLNKKVDFGQFEQHEYEEDDLERLFEKIE